MQRSTTSDVIQTRPPTRGYGFGPGAKEQLVLTTWTSSKVGKIRLTGWYDVFCGAGNSHTVRIDEGASASDFAKQTVDDVADELINFSLEDWSDDCDT